MKKTCKAVLKRIVQCLILGFALNAAAAFSNSFANPYAELQGPWAQPCTNGSFRTELFRGQTVTLNELFFSDKECKQPAAVFTNEGTYQIPAAGWMDFQFRSVRLRVMTEVAIKDFNLRKVCGYQDWQVNVEKEISGRSCEIFVIGLPQRIPTAGDMRYGIYRLEKNLGRLYFGKLSKDKNASTPEKRPQEFDPRFYQKVIF